MNLDNVTRDDWIVGGLALLLAIDLLLLPWFSGNSGTVATPIGTVTVGGGSLTATDAPDGVFGVLGVLAALAVVADLAVERLSPQTQIPPIGGSRTMTRFVLAVAAAGFVALKFLFQIHFSIFGFGFWFGIVLTAALVFFAMQARNAAPVGPSRPAGPVSGTGGSTPPPAS